MHSDPLKQYENGTVQYEKRTSFKKWFLNVSLDMFLSQRDFTLPSLIQKRSLLWSLFFLPPIYNQEHDLSILLYVPIIII